jgi:peroxiredoxin
MERTPLALALAITLAASSAPQTILAAPATALSGPQVGSAAPDFALRTLAGAPVSLAGYRGKTLVINVWATWCPPCRQEMPDLISTAVRLQKAGVAVLGIDTTEDAPIVRAYAAAKNVSYPQAIDSAKTFSSAYDVQYFPTTYVIDPQGILRARYIDVIAPKQLDALVAAANAGKDGVIASPLQTKIDAALAETSFTFTGDRAARDANAQAVRKAIDNAESLLDESDAATGNSTDLIRTRAEEAAIRDRAIASLENDTTPATDATLLPLLRGAAASDREQWQAALDGYTAVLASDPKNEDALSGVALAAARLKNYALVVDADTKLAALDPTSSSDLVELARAQVSAGSNEDAYATFEKAVALAQSNLAAKPKDAKRRRALAYAHLYFGRAYAKAGDTAAARKQFADTLAVASKLPPHDSRHDMYIEESQEAIVALRLGDGGGAAAVTLAPWTGPELPGSIPNTIKYRLVVAGNAGKTIALRASDVPKGWVASFCSDRVCAPFHVDVAIPENGVKIVEFQLVPPGATSGVPKVRVTGSGDGFESSATT